MNYTKNITVNENYDFIVCGGGMSGFACAVAAAERGLKTAIVERSGCLGGTGTSGAVCHLLGGRAHFADTNKCIHNVSGIFDRLTEMLADDGFAVRTEAVDRYKNHHGWMKNHLAAGVPFDPNAMKLYLERMCIEAGVKIYFFTNIIDVFKVEDKLSSVVVFNKSGIFLLSAKYFADTTGDADVAFFSGCDFEKGEQPDGGTAPATLEFIVDNVNTNKLSDYIFTTGENRFRKLITELREKGEWKFPYDILISVQLVNDDVYMINTSRLVGIDGTDGSSITDGMIRGREETFELLRILKKFVPGFENVRLRSIADSIGIRETRRIKGKYILSTDELINGYIHDDSIACSSYGWDLPSPKKPSLQPMSKVERKSRFTNIPYRCLLPNGVDNLIVAGRCISVERSVLGPVREMAPCIAMGEAAGIAAYIAHSGNLTFENVNISLLQSEIQASGGVYSVTEAENGFLINEKMYVNN